MAQKQSPLLKPQNLLLIGSLFVVGATVRHSETILQDFRSVPIKKMQVVDQSSGGGAADSQGTKEWVPVFLQKNAELPARVVSVTDDDSLKKLFQDPTTGVKSSAPGMMSAEISVEQQVVKSPVLKPMNVPVVVRSFLRPIAWMNDGFTTDNRTWYSVGDVIDIPFAATEDARFPGMRMEKIVLRVSEVGLRTITLEVLAPQDSQKKKKTRVKKGDKEPNLGTPEKTTPNQMIVLADESVQ